MSIEENEKKIDSRGRKITHCRHYISKGCTNPDTYGMICVKCNDCGRFNVGCCVCGKILKPEDEVITIEFYDVFCDFACTEHEDLIKKQCPEKYEDKYMFSGYKRDFKLTNQEEKP